MRPCGLLSQRTPEEYNGPTGILLTNVRNSQSILTKELENNFSTWAARIRTIRNVGNQRNRRLQKKDKQTPTYSEKYHEAERILVRELQKKYFPKEYALLSEIKDKQIDNPNEEIRLSKELRPNNQYELFLDSTNIIRCKGRLQNSSFPWDTINPILLPRNSHSHSKLYSRFTQTIL